MLVAFQVIWAARNCLQDKHQREKSCIWLFQVSVSVAVECAISQSRQLDIKGKDAARLQTALQAAQGLLLDVEAWVVPCKSPRMHDMGTRCSGVSRSSPKSLPKQSCGRQS